MSETDYRNVPDATLIDYIRNARATYSYAAGHGKAEANYDMLMKYQAEAASRGLAHDPAEEGVFNGPGAV